MVMGMSVMDPRHAVVGDNTRGGHPGSWGNPGTAELEGSFRRSPQAGLPRSPWSDG